MNVDFEINTVNILTGALRKSLSEQDDPAMIAIKLSLIKSDVQNINDVERLFNRFLVDD